jgi:hypothetical protein
MAQRTTGFRVGGWTVATKGQDRMAADASLSGGSIFPRLYREPNQLLRRKLRTELVERWSEQF